jgi:acetylornithine deacetylase
MPSAQRVYFSRLKELVALPSVSSSDPRWDMGNRAVVDLLANWLEAEGFSCRILPINDQPHKANLIAQRGTGPGGLVLAGHTDTVPCNPERWQSDPFCLTEKDQRLYGLGATDMKGFFPTVLQSLTSFKDIPLRQPLIVLATADEESSMSGARALQKQGFPSARAAVIGEPTGLKPIRLHKGILLETIEVLGQAGHSSNPALGVNAMEAMHQVMGSLMAFRQQLQHRHQHLDFAVPVPSLNLGCIHGGDNPNRICGRCELQFDLRPLPGMALEHLREQLRERLQPIANQTGTRIELRSLSEGIAPFEEPANSELVRLLEAFSGYNAEAVNFATEAPFLQALGMQTVILGPGSIDQAHQPDEYIPLADIPKAQGILEALIRHYCL